MSDEGADELVQLLDEDNKISKEWLPFIENADQISVPEVVETAEGSPITCSSKTFFDCTFSTAKVLDAFEIDSPPSNDATSIVLGLDNATSAGELSVHDILSAFGVPLDNLAKPVGPIISALTKVASKGLPKFTIDTELGSKCGTWIVAALPNTLEVVTALTFQFKADQVIGFDAEIQEAISEVLGINVDLPSLKLSNPEFKLRLKNKTFTVKAKDGGFASSSIFELAIQIPVNKYFLNVKLITGGRIEASLLNNGGTFSDLRSLLSNDAPLQSEANPPDDGFFKSPELWYLSVNIPTRKGEKITFIFAFIVTLNLEDQDLVINLQYDSSVKTFFGGLLFQTLFEERLDTNFNDLTDLPRGRLATLPQFYDLRKGGAPFDALPSTVPTRLTHAFIQFQKGGATERSMFSFSAGMMSASATDDDLTGDVPFPFEWTSVSLDFSREWGGSSSVISTSLDIFSSFELNPPDERFRTGLMSVTFSYLKSGAKGPASTPSTKWALSGSAKSIQFGSLAAFLDPSMKDEVLEILGKLTIDSLEVTYTNEKNVASSFLFICSLSFGSLVLKLYYQYASAAAIKSGATATHQRKFNSPGADPNLASLPPPKDETPSSWQLDAYLDTATPGSTIGSIADSIMDNASDDIPTFVSEIEVDPPDPSAKLITLHAGKTTKKVNGKMLQRATFLLSVAISTVEFTFMQVSTGPAPDPAIPKSPVANRTKRLLRLSVGRLPFIDNLPVVKELPQPYQELQYMWSPAQGLTRDEVAALNEKLILDGAANKLFFKAVTRAALDPTSRVDPVVLLDGHHFIVVHNNEAVVDHIFKPDPKPKTSRVTNDGNRPDSNNAAPVVANRGQGQPAEASSAPDAPPSKGTLRKQTPFVTIEAVSFQYKKGRLWIFLDGTIALGPLQFSLIGFGVGLQLSGLKLNDLSTLTNVADGIDFQLRGMEVAFDKPPILIAGCFYHDIIQRGTQSENVYRGGIAVTVPPYTFVAVGEYAEVTTKTGTYKSVFVYAKLDGPIIDFQFAILRGLRIGFGYNSMVRSPAVEELFDFPLLSNSASGTAGNHPMKILENMRGGPNPWIQLKQDAYWLAFGFTISSFNIINATAVAMVSFRDGGPIFTIMGNLTCSMPPDPPSEYARLFYVEVNLYAELNFVEDCFKVLAALAPSSFIYVPMARLHGGLALYSFFGRNPHAGDWVFSVGGYHRSFQRPAHYPIVPRVGLDFNIDIISIRGQGYFAITPKAVMAGAMIRCELSIGPVFAWLDAAFDAMVQFEPMHYWVSMHVEVGIECDIPLLFFTIHIRISLGARLEIEGPDFGGTAYVDFWFFSFSFDFGADKDSPKPISLQEFYALCEKSGPPDDSTASKPTANLNAQLKISLEDGAFTLPSEDKDQTVAAPPDDTGAGVKWYVKGGSFKFRVSSVFALTGAYMETEASANRDTNGNTVLLANQLKQTSSMREVTPSPTIKKLSSMPMQLSAPQNGADGIKSTLTIAIQDVDDKGLAISDFKPEFVIKPMPQALWADPVLSPPNRLTSDKGTVDLPMAVSLEAPDPVLAFAKVPAFNATDMAKACAGANQIPQLPPVTQTELLPLVDRDIRPLNEKWASTRDTWINSSTQGLSLANEMTSLCMSTLKWDKPPQEVVAKANASNTEPWKVPVAFPERLVKGTKREAQGIQDGLENFYLELPRMTEAVVH